MRKRDMAVLDHHQEWRWSLDLMIGELEIQRDRIQVRLDELERQREQATARLAEEGW